MAWRDQLRDASFRGAAFKVDGHDHTFGRRQEIHEYPLRTLPWAEDLGRAARRYAVEGYVIGADYFAARDALIRAVETEGPGELVHPYYGALQVVCVAGSVREAPEEGGQATFMLEFVEAGEKLVPAITDATQDQAVAAADEASAATADIFAAAFSLASSPSFVLDEALATVEGAMAAAEGVADRLAQAGEQLYAFRSKVADLRGRMLTLAQAPAQLAFAVIGVVRQVRQLAGTPAAALAALKPLTAFGSTLADVLGATPARRRQAANQAALAQLVRQAAAAEAVVAVAGLAFDSYPTAVAVRDDLADRIDAIALDAADAGGDAAWEAMSALRLAMVRDVTARGGSLARLYAFTPAAGEPALVLAHRVYGDAGRDGEIVARNRLRHPGFVPAGRSLELLAPGGVR